MHPPVDLLAGVCLSQVTGGRYNDNAGINKFFYFYAQRIIRVRIDSVCSKADINNTNVVSSLIFQDPVESAQKPGCLSRAGIVQYFYIDQIRVRSNSLESPVVLRSVARRKSGDVRAVTVKIFRCRRVGEIYLRDYSRGLTILETDMAGVDTRIQNCDSDPRAVESVCTSRKRRGL